MVIMFIMLSHVCGLHATFPLPLSLPQKLPIKKGEKKQLETIFIIGRSTCLCLQNHVVWCCKIFPLDRTIYMFCFFFFFLGISNRTVYVLFSKLLSLHIFAHFYTIHDTKSMQMCKILYDPDMITFLRFTFRSLAGLFVGKSHCSVYCTHEGS